MALTPKCYLYSNHRAGHFHAGHFLTGRPWLLPPPTQLVHNLQVAEVSVQSCFLARLSRLYAIAYVTEAQATNLNCPTRHRAVQLAGRGFFRFTTATATQSESAQQAFVASILVTDFRFRCRNFGRNDARGVGGRANLQAGGCAGEHLMLVDIDLASKPVFRGHSGNSRLC